MNGLPVVFQTALLLAASNVFMTFAWYAHLKNLNDRPWWIAALASWGIALFEYLLQVPANRIGHQRTRPRPTEDPPGSDHADRLRAVCNPSTWNNRLKLDYLWAGLCILGAVYFIFRGPMTYLASNKPITLPELARMKQEGEKIAMLTGYDASFAALEDRCGVDVILVGDSLGNVIQGKTSTLPVTMEQMVYHTECVGHMAQSRRWCVADMPFGAYQESKEQAIRNAGRLLAAGAEMVKLEGGEVMAETVHFLVERGVPVCAHIGLTPQSVHALGGYRVQGRDEAGAARMKADAVALEQAGAALMVLEMVPSPLGGGDHPLAQGLRHHRHRRRPDCDGQVLVLHDMLGIYPGKKGRFVKDFMAEAQSIEGAVKAYVEAVKDGTFPAPGALLLMQIHRHHRRPAGRAERRRRASHWCRPWATCTRAISR